MPLVADLEDSIRQKVARGLLGTDALRGAGLDEELPGYTENPDDRPGGWRE